MRLFNRHSSHLPVHISTAHNIKDPIKDSSDNNTRLENISHGGICCHVPQYYPKGTLLTITVPDIQEEYQGLGIAAWCKENPKQGYDLGIHFDDDNEAFNYRMVEQICEIEHYRNHIQTTEQRNLTSEQAAAEWIQKFAHSHPNPKHPPTQSNHHPNH